MITSKGRPAFLRLQAILRRISVSPFAFPSFMPSSLPFYPLLFLFLSRFGSLDEQSREQAVQVLQRLSYGNRLVGIISHVSELKESIDKKIIVKKGSAGSSIAWQE